MSGNHDIGYGRDMTRYRIDRWERVFGKTNFFFRVQTPIGNSPTNAHHHPASPPEHIFAVINSQNIDGPAWDEVRAYITGGLR